MVSKLINTFNYSHTNTYVKYSKLWKVFFFWLGKTVPIFQIKDDQDPPKYNLSNEKNEQE